MLLLQVHPDTFSLEISDTFYDDSTLPMSATVWNVTRLISFVQT